MLISSKKIKQTLSLLPNKPGVYQFFDTKGKLLYVGKAKSLKKRVSSYFTKQTFENGKTALLVKKTQDIKYLLTDTEYEALLLENSLIKEHQPKFNIDWRDDKSYPFICIKKERFPRVFGMRNPNDDNSEYYGPFASVKQMKKVLELCTRLYSLRNCNYQLSEENIRKGKFKICLEYHIGNCKGPCEGLQSEEDYSNSIDSIREIIKGNYFAELRKLKEEMKQYAEELDFERAQRAKERVELLEQYQGKSTVVNPSITNTDVFTIVADDKYCYVNFMHVADGAIVQAHNLELKKQMDESEQDILPMAVAELRQRFGSNASEILVPFEVGMEIPGTHFHFPQRGDKRKLLLLSEKNARQFMFDRHRKQEKTDPERATKRILETARQDLRMKHSPTHIECFDNSNLQGTNPVAACVVFKNAKPSKKDYRHFNIKTVNGPDDFASMEEVVHRRYKRLIAEGEEMPQLVIIDGGKGQLSAAAKSLSRLGLLGKITLIGIAKKLEEIYFPNDSVPLYIDKRSETFKLIQHLRNEAHRFGITHHRKKRSKSTIKSSLKDIPGIGDATAQLLLKKFKSVKRVKEARLTELTAAVGKAKGKILHNHFSKNEP